MTVIALYSLYLSNDKTIAHTRRNLKFSKVLFQCTLNLRIRHFTTRYPGWSVNSRQSIDQNRHRIKFQTAEQTAEKSIQYANWSLKIRSKQMTWRDFKVFNMYIRLVISTFLYYSTICNFKIILIQHPNFNYISHSTSLSVKCILYRICGRRTSAQDFEDQDDK